MKKIFGWVALLMGMVTGANAQVNDTIQRVTGNDLYQGITRKLPYRQMVTPHGVQVTFAKTVHIIFPSAVRYVDLGSNWIIAGKADGAENVIRVKATTAGFPGETNFSVICARCMPSRSSPYRTTSCWSSSCSRRTAAGTRPSGWRTPTSWRQNRLTN